MSEGPAEKKFGFERWVKSLKLEARTSGPREDSHHDTDDGSEPPPPAAPLSLDEQVTLVQRLPKEIVKVLRERESQRAQRQSSRPPMMGRVDEESTAVFVPPPELLARAKRFQPPPKPGREADRPPPGSPSDAPSKSANEMPTKPPPPFDESGPRSSPLAAAYGERRNSSSGMPAVSPLQASRTPAVAFPAAKHTPSGAFPAAKATPNGAFPAQRHPTPAHGTHVVTGPSTTTTAKSQPGLRGMTPAFGFPAQGMPQKAAQKPNMLRPIAPGVPSSVPRGFAAALIPASVEVIAPPAAAPPADSGEGEEPTSRARFAPVQPSQPPPDAAAPELEVQARLEAPTIADSEKHWGDEDDDEAPTAEHDAPTSEHVAARRDDEEEDAATQEHVAPTAPKAAASTGPKYLLWLGWTAAALIVAGAVWITYFKH